MPSSLTNYEAVLLLYIVPDEDMLLLVYFVFSSHKVEWMSNVVSHHSGKEGYTGQDNLG